MHEITRLLKAIKQAEPSGVAHLAIVGETLTASSAIISDPHCRYPEYLSTDTISVERHHLYDWVTIKVRGGNDPEVLLTRLLDFVSQTRKAARPAIREEVLMWAP